jgi:5-formyltetrahydrofolate cyclo-ligase
MPKEIDILTDSLLEKYIVYLPVVTAKDTPLKFVKYSDDLEPSPFFKNVKEPKTKVYGNPQVFCVPMLGFDSDLNRIGYGGGYYDRTLTAAHIKVGIAFEYMRLQEIPVEATDIRMDYIVTER